jgi:hypothetical protein
MAYPIEILDDYEDDGTMPESLASLERAVVGRRIVSAERESGPLTLTLDDGTKVRLIETSDCCAYTDLEEFFLNPEMVEHVITGVGTTDGYTTWHIFADFGDIMTLKVGWSAGNPFYYGYGFHIAVEEA